MSSAPSECSSDSEYITAEEFNSDYDSMADSEETNDFDSIKNVKLFIKFDEENDKLTVSFEGNQYVIYFLDLYDEEYTRLAEFCKSPNEEFRVTVLRKHISLHKNQLSVKRIPEPKNSIPAAFQAISKLSGTECISFSFKKNLMAKYKERYYFVKREKTLFTEYKDLIARTDSPMETPLRVRKERVIVNDVEHILDIMKRPTDFETDQEVIVIKGFDATKSKWTNSVDLYERMRKPFYLKRYMKYPAKNTFRHIPNSLIYSHNYGDCDELYAETDFVSLTAAQDAIKLSHIHDYVWESSSEEECCDTDDVFQTVASSRRPRVPHLKHRVPSALQKLYLLPLKSYPVSGFLRELISANFRTKNNNSFRKEASKLLTEILNYKSIHRNIRINSSNYNRIFSLALQMEDEYQRREMLTYNQRDARITYVHDPFPDVIDVEGAYCIDINMCGGEIFEAFEESVADKRIYFLNVQPMQEQFRSEEEYAVYLESDTDDIKPNGTILKIVSEKLYFTTSKPIDLKHSQSHFVRFLHNPITYQINQQALDFVESHHLYDIILPKNGFKGDVKVEDDEIEWIQKDLNIEQKTAVHNILKKTSYPYPFILFGPPGTGKTKTLVEAIAQIVTTSRENILVCATSNLACDVLALMLMKKISKDHIYRLYSKLTNAYNMSPEIKAISNCLDIENVEDQFYPALEFLNKFQVVICTLTVAGRLCQANLRSKYPRHFSYVFVDECASANEISALVPIAGVCSMENRVTAHIVLAGDPKQLGPVVRCHMANQLGLGTSLIERLMYKEPYIRNPCTKRFNSRYILQLTSNYRSHESILRFSNKEFYENTIVSKAYRSVVTKFISTEILPSPHFPIVFKSVRGACRRSNKLSYFNIAEMNEVINYVEQLISGIVQPGYGYNGQNGKRRNIQRVKMDDIGIVTTYRGQSRALLKQCKDRGWDDLKIGTVNLFQGEEKSVIIVSTVRSGDNTVGFLSDWKRLNVLMTRAKSLLIIVGDPFTLQFDKRWNQLLLYLQTNNAIIQSNTPFVVRNV